MAERKRRRPRPEAETPENQTPQSQDEQVEVASEDSFPASDPPSYTSVRHPGRPSSP